MASRSTKYSVLPARKNKPIRGMGMAEERWSRWRPTRPSQPLSATIYLGSDKGPRRRRISEEVVDGSSESLAAAEEVSASFDSSEATLRIDGLGSGEP